MSVNDVANHTKRSLVSGSPSFYHRSYLFLFVSVLCFELFMKEQKKRRGGGNCG